MFLYIVSSFTQNEWFLTILSCHATSVPVLPLCCNTKDGPVPPGPPLSWKPSNIRGSAWGEEVDVESCFLIVEIGEVHWRLGPGNSNFMDGWAERSLEGFGIYNQDEEKQFSSERQVLWIHLQGGFLLYSSNWTYVFSCAFLFFLFGKHVESTATCRVSTSGHDSLEKGGNFRNSHWLFKQLPAVQLQERNKKHRDVEIWVAFWQVWRFLSFLNFWVICGVHVHLWNSFFSPDCWDVFCCICLSYSLWSREDILTPFFLNDVV